MCVAIGDGEGGVSTSPEPPTSKGSAVVSTSSSCRHTGSNCSSSAIGSSSLDSSTGIAELKYAPSLRALDALDVLAVPLRLGITCESSRARACIRTHESCGQTRCERACHMEFAASCADRDSGQSMNVEMQGGSHGLVRAVVPSGRHPRGRGPSPTPRWARTGTSLSWVHS